MKRRSTIVIAAGLAATLSAAIGAGSLRAASAASPHDRPLVALRDEMKMTPEQRQQVRQVLIAHRDEIAAVARPLVEANRALRDAVLAETPDDAAIRAAADAMGKAAGDAAVLAAKLKPELRAVLTADQIQALATFGDDVETRVDAMLDRIETAGR